jgi:UPF0755 protein
MTILGLRLPAVFLFFLIFPALWLLWVGFYAISPGPASAEKQIEVVIPARSSVAEIKEILAENKIIRDDPRFSMLAIMTGASKRLRAGEYSFEGGKSPLAIIDFLKTGKVFYRPVTIPEGTEMARIADILAAGEWIDRSRFLNLGYDPGFAKEMGLEADSLEGYLFPDTYYLSRGQQDEKEIIRMMISRHFKVFEEIIGSGTSDFQGLTHHEIITLASIVEKETGLSEERPLVASVFLNRLAKGMRLQADPTVRYGFPDHAGPLTQNELKKNTPYNTYTIKGLPPGPISNPGKAAIEAVLFPAKTDFFFFVTKDDNSHYFSRTLKEHNRAVSRSRQQSR